MTARTRYSQVLTNVNLAGQLATVLENRMADRHEKMATLAHVKNTPETQSVLLARIRRFFGL